MADISETERGTAAARAAFPSGLEQPEGSFRFSRDALLLAEFAAGQELPERAVLAELGTGCGVVSLAALLKRPLWKSVGLEREAVLADAAARNAAVLGLGGAFMPLCGDVASREDLRFMRETLARLGRVGNEGGTPAGQPGQGDAESAGNVPLSRKAGLDKAGDAGVFLPLPGQAGGQDSPAGERAFAGELPLFDAVMANPPWRVEGAGRVPPSELRRRALFGTPETFRQFFNAADALLKSGGMLLAVSGAERTADMLSSLPKRLHPEVLRFVFTKENAPAEFVLLLARKNGRGALKVEKAEV